MTTDERREDAASVLTGLRAFIDDATQRASSTNALDPGHRVKFHWPPHPVSYSYHVLATDWKGSITVDMHGENFDVTLARTPHGVFGRCESLWLESRGTSEEDLIRQLAVDAEPLFQRQFSIARCLGRSERFDDHFRDLSALDLVRLLYCSDRDVANDARIQIETHASQHVFTAALIEVLRDQLHPNRRSAQWCVLDLFEDLPAFVSNAEEETAALEAIKELIWNATDDFARTIYKAGVVLGGHLAHINGGRMLLDCLLAPSKIGRRSAIHGLFHTVEWVPEMRSEVVEALNEVAQSDSEPLLREFAGLMARDIGSGDNDHIQEPIFDGER
jgi:hypothetical protein